MSSSPLLFNRYSLVAPKALNVFGPVLFISLGVIFPSDLEKAFCTALAVLSLSTSGLPVASVPMFPFRSVKTSKPLPSFAVLAGLLFTIFLTLCEKYFESADTL